jgi:tetratricopeptide (TPR) repeat protein
LFGSGNFAAAERLAREALAADPNAAAAHTLLARALVRLGRAKPALAAAQAALALAPNAMAFQAQALALSALRRSGDAVAAAREAIRLAPLRADSTHLLGIVLEQSGQWDAAGTMLRHAMSLAPANDTYRASYGLFLLRHRKLDEAERVALDLASAFDGTEALLLRGKVALLRHRPAEALDFALWILSRDATSRLALSLMVEAKAGQSRPLRLWWRYRVFVATGSRWVLLLISGGLLLSLMVPGLRIIAITILFYMSFARRTFRRQLQRELQALRGVTLNKRF